MKLRVGDRVKYTDTNPPFTGKKGKIVSRNPATNRVRVVFDEPLRHVESWVCLSRSLKKCNSMGIPQHINKHIMK
jgi:hypothetical protein